MVVVGKQKEHRKGRVRKKLPFATELVTATYPFDELASENREEHHGSLFEKIFLACDFRVPMRAANLTSDTMYPWKNWN